MSNTVIALKKSATPSAAPVDLANGELAINYADGKLFYKHANGTIAAIEGGGTGGDSFGTINANGTLIVADTPGDILTIEAGTNVTITADAINDKITISASGGTGDLSPALIQANTARDHANAAFASANAGQATANAAFDKANSANITADRAFNHANAAFITANIAFANANTVMISAQAAFTVANAAFLHANSGYAFANSIAITANNAFLRADLGVLIGNAAIAQANTARNHANTAHATANAALIQANTARNQANLAFSQANAAFASSNSVNIYSDSTYVKLSATSQTITGNVNIVGDLTLSGNTFVIDATRLEVDDPLIYLAANNYVSDIVDIGFIANYVNATGQNVHTGLYREHEDKMYYLFQGYDREPINNHLGALSNNMTLAVLNADLRTSNLVLGGANAILTIGAAFDKANAALPNTSGISFNGNLNFPTGNVGIGTATPSSRLEVLGDVSNSLSNLGTGDAATITITNANVGGLNRIAKTLYEIGNLPIASIAGAYTVFNAGGNIGGDLIFSTQRHVGTGVQERMRIDANGKVGIGTSTPNTKLMVYGTTGSTADFRITGQNINSFMSSFAIGDGDWVPIMELLKINGTDTARSNVRVGAPLGRINWYGARGNTGDALVYLTGQVEVITTSEASGGAYPGGDMLFKTSEANNAFGAFERMRIDSNGHLIISSSAARIRGDFSNTTFSSRTAFQTSTVNGESHVMVLPNGTGNTSSFRAVSNSDPTNSSWLQFQVSEQLQESRIQSGTWGTSTTLPLTFFVGSERMRIANTGNVLIGRSDSTVGQNVKLDVNGAINASAVLVNGTPLTSGSGSGTIALNQDAVNATRYLVFANNLTGNLVTANVSAGISFNPSSNTLNINGALNAVTKSFVIPHPVNDGMMLRYGSLEGPENGVYVRGKLEGKSVIELPDYWWNLIDEETITVNLTPYGRSQDIWVQSTSAYFIHLNQPADCFFTVFAERKDVDKLVVEY